MNASIAHDWGSAVELAQQKIGMQPARLANLLKGLGETPDTLVRLIDAMPGQPGKVGSSVQTMMLGSGVALFASIAAATLVAAPVVVPVAVVLAVGSGILAKQSSVQDKQRAADAYEAVIDSRLNVLEVRAQSKLVSGRMMIARESLLVVKTLAANYEGEGPQHEATEMEVEEELSEADLNRFFRSLDMVEPDVAPVVANIEQQDSLANDVSGEEIASLFGVGGNNLFVSSSSPSL
ncbi:hypothetical protein [Vogesella sp. XCS3]|uniref:hypothetical protein n=1 Tax=Vogesella sp. XCS3 TaxID=2877939 RepID=UPI001D0B3DB3|nr:hypothetical protein [Vogesella sp. XCS3]UDM18941.1 hypothetical protein LCH97_18020 [Vogesella sp. XCS3]